MADSETLAPSGSTVPKSQAELDADAARERELVLHMSKTLSEPRFREWKANRAREKAAAEQAAAEDRDHAERRARAANAAKKAEVRPTPFPSPW